MANVLLLDAHTIQALPVMKALKKSGHKVFIECETKKSYGYYSRYSDVKFIKPLVDYNSNVYLQHIIKLVEKYDIDILLPLFDDSAQFASKYKEILKCILLLSVPTYDVFLKGYRKNNLMCFCKENGIPHPKTIELTIENIDYAAEYTGLPAIIKPDISFGARGMMFVNNIKEIKILLKNILRIYGTCTLQEFIPPGGRQYMVHHFRTVADEFLSSMVVEKIRYYPETGGSSCCNRTISYVEIETLTKKVLSKLNWEGIAHFDLIEDPRDNVIKIMEINPRLSGSIKSSFKAGVDYANIYVDYCLGNQIENYNIKYNVYVRYLGLDILWFLKSVNRFNSNPSWFKFIGKDICFQEGGLDDPFPFLFGTYSGIKKLFDFDFRKSKSGLR
ncbi:carboxylate--amine ligase [Chlorobium phaeobacteroides]|uniref:Carbamoylphosphate synthase large subunit-like protein n=1 Tax=Chlorobium phaeobacteroides (strain DSM 266 / SMG 266 / 2430) TaxID=290317 RepID=A1BJM8_CHLPD|nr:ATP-grasp domain-containing protein [Chlorobium phaeobacteroides]ABL66605.1 Carbamoylphosphate synthase large subunit-like protein [Chlorobium phaeobacteroides DSM 266]